jgi:hypothetical protein
VTRDRARKKAIRARMAASGEAYSVAARGLDDAAPPDGAAETICEVIARAEATLAAPSARIEWRIDTDITHPERPRRRPGLMARLAAAAWNRVPSGVDAADLRDAFKHQHGEGFLEPAAGRYQVDYRAYAELRADGRCYAGLSGAPLGPRFRDDRPREQHDDPLGLLEMVRAGTDARQVGTEAVHGTMCRKVAVQSGPAELTVWVDDDHIRRVRYAEGASGPDTAVTRSWTLELWDFGVPADSLDWSRLPSFRTPPGP